MLQNSFLSKWQGFQVGSLPCYVNGLKLGFEWAPKQSILAGTGCERVENVTECTTLKRHIWIQRVWRYGEHTKLELSPAPLETNKLTFRTLQAFLLVWRFVRLSARYTEWPRSERQISRNRFRHSWSEVIADVNCGGNCAESDISALHSVAPATTAVSVKPKAFLFLQEVDNLCNYHKKEALNLTIKCLTLCLLRSRQSKRSREKNNVCSSFRQMEKSISSNFFSKAIVRVCEKKSWKKNLALSDFLIAKKKKKKK